MTSAASHPHLRLVGVEQAPLSTPDRDGAELAVIKENRLAAHAPAFDPRDPRWMLAMQTHARLEGAVLTPERRDELMRTGARLGLRPFESTLVIAIVQDRARCGLPLDEGQPILRLVRPPAEQSRRADRAATWRWLLALAAGLAAAWALTRWISS